MRRRETLKMVNRQTGREVHALRYVADRAGTPAHASVEYLDPPTLGREQPEKDP